MADLKVVRRLREMPIFSHLNAKELAVLGMVMSEQVAADGEVLCREGARGEDCYFIIDGAITVTKRLANGAQRHIATLRSGELFGQVALVDTSDRSATCTAQGETRLLRLERQDFDTLFNSGSTFAFKFQALIATVAARQLREANRRLNMIVRRQRSGDFDPTDTRDDLNDVQAILARSDAHQVPPQLSE